MRFLVEAMLLLIFSFDFVFFVLFSLGYFLVFLSVFVDFKCLIVVSFDSVNLVVLMHCVEH